MYKPNNLVLVADASGQLTVRVVTAVAGGKATIRPALDDQESIPIEEIIGHVGRPEGVELPERFREAPAGRRGR